MNRVERVLLKITALLCITLLLCLFIEVINRYVFFVSWPEIQFIVPFCFLWMCMISAAIAVRKGQHFEVDLLSKLFQSQVQKIHRILIILSIFAGGVIIAWSSISFAELGFLKKEPATGIRMIYIHASILIGGVLIAIMALDRLVVSLKGGAIES